MYYILNQDIALRSFWRVPYAYYIKGIRDARKLTREEYELLLRCDGKTEIEERALAVDLSAGDAITPEAVCLSYPMMFDQGSIELRSYNIETLLDEKIETILSRSTANTRMRDFYDTHILWNDASNEVDIETLRDAIRATASKRGTDYIIEDGERILEEIAMSPAMKYQWDNYQRTNKYAGDLAWDEVIESVSNILLDEINLDQTDDFEMTMF